MRTFLALTFTLIFFSSIAQEDVLFNYNYPLQDNWEYNAMSLIIEDSSYYLYGGTTRILPECQYQLIGYHFTKIDSQGIKDTTIIYDICGQNTYSGWQGSAKKYQNNLYSIAYIDEFNDTSKINLLKYNFNLDTIASFYYLEDTLVKRCYSLTIKNNEIIMCAGTDSSYNENNSPLPDTVFSKATLIKTNINGEIIFRKSYSFGNEYDGCWSNLTKSIFSFDNKNYSIGKSNDFSSNTKPIILKTDSLGNEEWVHAYGSNTYSNPRFMDIIETRDSSILVCGAFTYGESFGGLYPYDGWLLKLNPNGSTVWNRKYRDSISSGSSNDYYAYYKSIVEKPNGDILAVLNTKSDLEGNYIGTKFRLRCHSSFGDIKWERVFDSVGNGTGPIYPQSIKLDSNNNIIISGYAEIFYYDEEDNWTSDQRIFLIKTDSLGNDSLSYISEPQPTPISRYELEVYPNPVSNQLHINLPANFPGGDMQIINQQGQIVNTTHLPRHEQSPAEVNVSSLSPGHYLVQIKTGKNYYYGKFVKN